LVGPAEVELLPEAEPGLLPAPAELPTPQTERPETAPPHPVEFARRGGAKISK
jgi:hypothetical protein